MQPAILGALVLLAVASGPLLQSVAQPPASPPPAQQTYPATPEGQRARWNEIFTRQPPTIRTDANEFLVRVVSELKPGTALDIGMGFGRNALYLARQGWQVTGVDISDVGVDRARQRAEAEKLPLTAIREDMFKYDYGRDRFDLVLLMYMSGERNGIADRIYDTLKPGGLLVIEHFVRRPDEKVGYLAGEVPKLHPKLDVLRYVEEEGVPDYSQKTRETVVRFLARKPPLQEAAGRRHSGSSPRDRLKPDRPPSRSESGR
jgi:SAM-dependent methyltransferase